MGHVTVVIGDGDGDRDGDGVGIIPRQAAEEAIGKAEGVVRAENHIRTAMMERMHPLTAYRKYGRF